MNKKSQIAGIKLLLKNYSIQPDTIDLESIIDSKCTFRENWSMVKEEFVPNIYFCGCCGKYVGGS